MTLEERERMEYLCKRIAVEKDPFEIERLVLKLNDLISPTLKSVQPKPKRKTKYEVAVSPEHGEINTDRRPTPVRLD